MRDSAEYLGVSVKFVRKLINDDKLPSYKVGKLIFLKVEEIDSLIESTKMF